MTDADQENLSELARCMLEHWGLRSLPTTELAGGLINNSWSVGAAPEAVLQRLHPVFSDAVHEDIEAVTTHLSERGFPTPRLRRTLDGAISAVDPEGRPWRVLSWVPGKTLHSLRSPETASEAGSLVGRWHRALEDCRWRFRFSRPGAHDTPAHMLRLQESLRSHRGHRLRPAVEQLSEELSERWSRWDGPLEGTMILGHGDLKISNLRFTSAGRGHCLLDLDTMGRLSLHVELGDAWRSWCNRAPEGSPRAELDLELFEASARAYLQARPLPMEQREELVWGLERIALELSSRFALDALEESYFGWDPRLAAGRGEHNLLRAEGQLDLARQAARARPALQRTLCEDS